jgi:hypothetical protein
MLGNWKRNISKSNALKSENQKKFLNLNIDKKSNRYFSY